MSYSRIDYGAQRMLQDMRWGSSSVAEASAEHLGLDDHLDWVPKNGTVMDLGAGISCSLGAAIHIRRPDISIINVDPGFAYSAPTELDVNYDDYSGTSRRKLKKSTAWHDNRAADMAEELTAEDASVDMIVSYASIPLYAQDDKLALKQMLRVLKVGGIALLGPISDEAVFSWIDAFKDPEIAEQIDQHDLVSRDIDIPHLGYPVHASFSTIYK